MRHKYAAIARRDPQYTEIVYVFGSITGGTTSEVEPGVRFVSGSPRQTAARFREHAAPGQILVADDVWQACRDVVVTSGAPVLVTIPGSEPVSSRALISLR